MVTLFFFFFFFFSVWEIYSSNYPVTLYPASPGQAIRVYVLTKHIYIPLNRHSHTFIFLMFNMKDTYSMC